jgi:hypothetical protein
MAPLVHDRALGSAYKGTLLLVQMPIMQTPTFQGQAERARYCKPSPRQDRPLKAKMRFFADFVEDREERLIQFRALALGSIKEDRGDSGPALLF